MNKLYIYMRIINPYTHVVWIANPDNAAGAVSSRFLGSFGFAIRKT